eukprot:8757254-Alexandrium_andersonii.AAC.1
MGCATCALSRFRNVPLDPRFRGQIRSLREQSRRRHPARASGACRHCRYHFGHLDMSRSQA